MTFKDILYLEETLCKFNLDNSLVEAPEILNIDVSLLDIILKTKIKDIKGSKSFIKISDNVFVYPVNIAESIYILVKDKKIKGAVETLIYTIEGIQFIQPQYVRKFEEDEKDIMLQLYSSISKTTNKFILSGNFLTESSYNFWNKMINTDNIIVKYFLNNKEIKKPLDLWQNKNILIGIKF